MILLAVNYHYVGDPAPSPRAIYPVSAARLEEQLRSLGRAFRFVSRDDLVAAAEAGAPLPDRACVVTFDDGLRSQVDVALPVLDRLGIPAIFFVLGRPLAERRGLAVHKLHHLRERIPPEELLDLLSPELARIGRGLDEVSPQDAARQYRYDDPPAARLKYLLNVSLDPAQRDTIVDALFGVAFPDEEAFVRETYLGPADVLALERRSGVGSHGYAHLALSRLAAGALAEDLRRGADAVGAVTGSRPRVVSYPYGSSEAVDARVADAAREAGFVVGFTMERAFNRTLDQPLLLARVDTNDALGGRSPLFDDSLRVRAGMTAARERYVAEAAS